MDVKSSRQKPPRVEVLLDNIPDELKRIPQWHVWKWEWREKSQKWDKPPYAIDGSYGSSTDASKWCTFDEAVAALPRFDGLGLAMGAGIGMVGIDLDDCRDPASGFLSVEAEAIIEQLDTYCEISPSKTGVKLWLLGDYDKTQWRSKVGNVETYCNGRYFTVTGQKVNDRPIAKVGSRFVAFLDKYLSKPTEEPAAERTPVEASDDQARIKQAVNACLKVEIPESEGDGSRRVIKYARQCVRAGVSAEGCVKVIRSVTAFAPLPEPWSDDRIITRYKQALTQSDVGEAIKVYEQSDYGVARRVRDYAAGSLLYIPEWCKWLAWNGRAFEIDRHGKLIEVIVAISKQMAKEDIAKTGDEKKDDAAEKAWHAFCMSYQSKRGIENIEKIARSFMAVEYKSLDKKTDLYHCENGVVRLSGQTELGEHSRDHLNTKVSEVPYIPDAKCPRWEQFMREITAGDDELSRYLQMLFGYCLTGDASQELFILHGEGRNGKGVYTRTLLKLLGEYGGVISQDLLMNSPNQHPTQFAYLYGKRCVVAQETDQDCRLNENQVKMLTGGDSIQCRRMREDFWEFQPTHKILLATNHVPTIRGSDNGIWRRIKLIPFTVIFKEQDNTLEPAITAELPGILQWALRGLGLLNMLGGFVEPEAAKKAREEYREEMSIVQQFVDDRCTLDPAKSVESSKLYQSFKLYCEEHGHYLCSQRKLGNDLAKLGIKQGKTTHLRVKIGIGLNDF
jgi:putative DNA primase/helicase